MASQSDSEILVALQQRLKVFFGSRVQDGSIELDLVGKVNERVLRGINNGDKILDVERYTFGVARHVLQEYWREVKRRRAIEETLADTFEERSPTVTRTTDTSVSSRKFMLSALSSCIDQLPEEDREMARRCYGSGTSKENRAALAQETGLSRNSLDARISRIRVKLEACVRLRLEEKFGNESV